MKTFYELGTMPKVGDLIMRYFPDNDGFQPIFMITSIIGDTYHTHKNGAHMHVAHLRCYYSPLGQDTQ